MKQSVTVGAQLLWSSRYGCNNVRYGCTIVMSYIEINKAVSQWLLTFNLCVSATWPLTCAFHIPCMHTPEIIDMHRGMCDNHIKCIFHKRIHQRRKYNDIFPYSQWLHHSRHCKQPRASKAALAHVGHKNKCIYLEQTYNHNKAVHSKIVCTFNINLPCWIQ